jgi:ATP-dependent Lon protease
MVENMKSSRSRPKRKTSEKRVLKGKPRRIETGFKPDGDQAITIPDELPLLPLRGEVVFPNTVVPLIVDRPSGIELVDHVLSSHRLVGLVAQKTNDEIEAGPDDIYRGLCIGSIVKMLKFPDGTTRIVCQGLSRGVIREIKRTEPYMTAVVEPVDEVVKEGIETEAVVHHVSRLFQRIVDQSQQVPEELQVAAMNTPEPGRFADLLGSSLPFSVEEKQELLEERLVRNRLLKLGQYLGRQIAVLELSTKIQDQVGAELSKAQRDHFLRQQIKAIQDELGEGERDNPDIDELSRKIEQAELPPEASAEAIRELERLGGMHPSSAEYSVIRTYIDWLTCLPWNKSSRDRLDLRRARTILDADHYNLEKIKTRILEYLAVRKLKKDMKGPILCFAGPPGTGKTSLGKSIAKALGRQFARVSLGGVHDEAEIRGHRRTYVAAMPGRIIQGIRKAGTNNPVFMLDEVDKLGHDFRGDPSAALLEVLDPEQNGAFRDHYLDVDFDLSRVMFIATANMLETIPPALLDRMEVLELSGYSEEEKTTIARKFIVPKQLEAHGLDPQSVRFSDEAIRRIIVDYTREAGLRNLEREVAAVCRKAARRRAEGKKPTTDIDTTKVVEALGPARYFRELADQLLIPGVATGLAWTPTGGEILFIEASGMPGKGSLTLTGLLGESMRESAQAALSYLKSHAKILGLDSTRVGRTDIHIHVPAGAVPKDGPSAGVAIAAALMSLFRHEPIEQTLAMTGEVTLTGRVLPVGGIREKALAARRAGIKTMLIPRHNAKDVADLPAEVKADLSFPLIDTLDDVVPRLFEKPTVAGRVEKKGRGDSPRVGLKKGGVVPKTNVSGGKKPEPREHSLKKSKTDGM